MNGKIPLHRFFKILHVHSAFAVEHILALKKWGHQISLWDISFVDK